jgi:hypothetical protein
VQASDGTDYADVGSDGSGYPVARIMGNGKINRDDFRSARRYWGIYKRARAALGEVKDA